MPFSRPSKPDLAEAAYILRIYMHELGRERLSVADMYDLTYNLPMHSINMVSGLTSLMIKMINDVDEIPNNDKKKIIKGLRNKSCELCKQKGLTRLSMRKQV